MSKIYYKKCLKVAEHQIHHNPIFVKSNNNNNNRFVYEYFQKFEKSYENKNSILRDNRITTGFALYIIYFWTADIYTTFVQRKKINWKKKKRWPRGNETYIEYQINQHNHTIASQSIHKPGYAFPKRTRTWNIEKQIKGNWHIFSHFN